MKCQKYLIDKYMVKSSLLNVVYWVYVGRRYLEKQAIGNNWSPIYCCSTAPTAVSEASHMMDIEALALGKVSSVELHVAKLKHLQIGAEDGLQLSVKF